MRKTDLVDDISTKVNATKKDIATIVDEVFSAIVNTLTSAGEYKIKEFGKFKVVTTKPRMGRNPKTGEQVEIPAKKRVRFSASPVLNRSVD